MLAAFVVKALPLDAVRGLVVLVNQLHGRYAMAGFAPSQRRRPLDPDRIPWPMSPPDAGRLSYEARRRQSVGVDETDGSESPASTVAPLAASPYQRWVVGQRGIIRSADLTGRRAMGQ